MTVAPPVPAGGLEDRAVGMRTGELFTAHGRMVFAICRSMLRDQDEAEDATQAAFLSAHEALVRGSEIRDPGAWLATIARNECRGRLRGRRTEALELRVDDLADSVTTDDDAERRATVAQLRSAIAALPEKQRDAVVLRDLYGLRYGEICVALGVSRPSVEALLFRARRTLRVRLRPVGGAALAVPLAVREGLAQAVPWFAPGPAVGVSAAAGAGILAQLGGSVAAKVAVGVVAVGVAGSAVGSAERRVPPGPVTGSHVAQVPDEATGTDGRVSPVERTVDPLPAEVVPAKSREPHVRPPATPPPVSAVGPRPTTEQPVSLPAASRAEPTPEPPRTRATTPSRPAPAPSRAASRIAPAQAASPRVDEPRVSVPGVGETRVSQPGTAVPRGAEATTPTAEPRTDPVTTTPTRTEGSSGPTR